MAAAWAGSPAAPRLPCFPKSARARQAIPRSDASQQRAVLARRQQRSSSASGSRGSGNGAYLFAVAELSRRFDRVVQVAAGGGQEVGHCRIVLSHVRDVFAEPFPMTYSRRCW